MGRLSPWPLGVPRVPARARVTPSLSQDGGVDRLVITTDDAGNAPRGQGPDPQEVPLGDAQQITGILPVGGTSGCSEEKWGAGRRAPLPGRPAYAPPLSPRRQLPASVAFDSNRPQPLRQPPPTAYPTASGATPEAPSFLGGFGVSKSGLLAGGHRCQAGAGPRGDAGFGVSAVPHAAPAHVWYQAAGRAFTSDTLPEVSRCVGGSSTPR